MKGETYAPQQEYGAEDRALSEFEILALENAAIVTKKDAAYGNAVTRSGDILQILYPNGVKPEQYHDMLTVTRVLDKLSRIATDNDPFGEDPWSDINGYSLLRMHQRKKNKENQS